MRPYFQEAGITLYLGDCREILPSLGSVDHILTDPPYSAHVHANARDANTKAGTIRAIATAHEFGFDCLDDDTRRFAAWQFSRLSRRWVLIFSDSENAHLWRPCGELESIRTGAWIKRGTTPQFTGDRPAAGFEQILIFHPVGKKRWNGRGKPGIWETGIVKGGTAESSKEPRVHPAQKPLALIAQLIVDFTDEGETILDPFAGSGTTGLAAKTLARRAILIERTEQHCETIAKRLAQSVLQFGAEEARASREPRP